MDTFLPNSGLKDYERIGASNFWLALFLSLGLHGAVMILGNWSGAKIDFAGHQIQKGALHVDFHEPSLQTVGSFSVESSPTISKNMTVDDRLSPKHSDNKADGAEKGPAIAMPSRSTADDAFGPWYFTSRYLHRRPMPVAPVQLIYPANAADLGGRVQLLLFIGKDGAVDKYEVVESEPPGVFDKPTIDTFTSVRYQPGLITGYPVRSQLLLEVTYSPGQRPQTAEVMPDKETPRP